MNITNPDTTSRPSKLLWISALLLLAAWLVLALAIFGGCHDFLRQQNLSRRDGTARNDHADERAVMREQKANGKLPTVAPGVLTLPVVAGHKSVRVSQAKWFENFHRDHVTAAAALVATAPRAESDVDRGQRQLSRCAIAFRT